MVPLSLSQFFALYTWFPLALILFILLLIARFYQKSSGERTFFRVLIVPIIAFGFAGVRYAANDQIVGDGLADAALVVAGLTLTGMSLMMYWHMIVQLRRRKPDDQPEEQEQPQL